MTAAGSEAGQWPREVAVLMKQEKGRSAAVDEAGLSSGGYGAPEAGEGASGGWWSRDAVGSAWCTVGAAGVVAVTCGRF